MCIFSLLSPVVYHLPFHALIISFLPTPLSLTPSLLSLSLPNFPFFSTSFSLLLPYPHCLVPIASSPNLSIFFSSSLNSIHYPAPLLTLFSFLFRNPSLLNPSLPTLPLFLQFSSKSFPQLLPYPHHPAPHLPLFLSSFPNSPTFPQSSPSSLKRLCSLTPFP